MVTAWTQCSQEMRKLIIKEKVHIQLLIKLIDLPHASTGHQEVYIYDMKLYSCYVYAYVLYNNIDLSA